MSAKTTLKQEGNCFVTRRNVRIYMPNNFKQKRRQLTKKLFVILEKLKTKKPKVKKLKFYLKRRIIKKERIVQNRLCGVFWEKELRSRGVGEIYLLGYEWVPTKKEWLWWKAFNRSRVKLEYTQEDMEYRRIMKEWEEERKKVS